MKKTISFLIIGLLIMGANAFAADGDFIVERLGVGIDPPNDKLHVAGDATLGDGTDTSRYIKFDRTVTDQKFGYDNTIGFNNSPGFYLSDSIYINRTENFQGYYLGPNGQYGGFVKKNGYPNPMILSDTVFLGTDSFGGAIALDTIWDSQWAYCEGVVFDTGTVKCADYNTLMTENDNFWVWKNGHNAGNPGIQENRRDLKFLFDGETNDGVMGFMEDEDYFYYDDNVVFNGNVGIGTTTPNQKLSVNGSIGISADNWNGMIFGDTNQGFLWRAAFGKPAINSNSFILGWDGNIAEIYVDTFRDGAWAYCEGVTASAVSVNCADYAGIMDSNDYYWVWKHGNDSRYPETADYKLLFDGESNDGVMGYMEDEDHFFFDDDVVFNGRLGIGTGSVYPLDITSTDQRALNIVTTNTATATGWEQGALTMTVTDSQTSGTEGNIGGIVLDYTHDGSITTNHMASRVAMHLSGSGTSVYDIGKIAQASSIVFEGPEGTGYNYTNPYAYAFASRAAIMTLGPKKHYFKNAGGLQILHQYDNSSRTLSAENLYGILVGDISQYSSGGLDVVNNAGGILINKQTDSAGGRINNLQGIWMNGDGAGADIVFGPNKETKLYGSSGNFIVDTTGNVGIGTVSPSHKLTVQAGVDDGFALTNASGELKALVTTNVNDDGKIILYDSGNVPRINLAADGAAFFESTDVYFRDALSNNVFTVNISGNEVVFNDAGLGTVGFRAEGDNDESLLFIDAGTDRVGIGTATPDSLLHVAGNSHIGGNLTVDGDILGSFTVDGNVGIGTSSPDTAIEISASNPSPMIRFSDLPDADNTLLETYRDTGTAGFKLRAGGPSQEFFYITDSALEEIFTVDVLDKEVGIGVGDPQAKFHIVGDGTAVTGGQILISGETDVNDKMWIGFDTTDNYGFIQSSVDGTYEDLILNAGGGNVGIGTVNPLGKLHTEDLLLDLGTGNCPAGYTEGSFGGTADADCLATGIVALANGNVGIGTASPLEKLYVDGNIYATGVVTWGSSRELKENIRELSTGEALIALNGLQPMKYNYKADKKDEHIGFVAEDVPELLATKDRKSLDPMDIVAVLTSVVKEQQKMAEEQQKIIKDQQKELKELKIKVQRLESKDLMVQIQQ